MSNKSNKSNKLTGRIELLATTAREARTEIRGRWPKHEVDFIGYDEDGGDVFISTVRKQGDRAHVATAHRNRSKPPVRFFATRFR